MRRKWFRTLLGQRLLVILLMVAQLILFLHPLYTISQVSQWFNTALHLFSLIMVLCVVSRREKGAYRLSWSGLILLFPAFGGILYLLLTFQTSWRKAAAMLRVIETSSAPLLRSTPSRLPQAEAAFPAQGPQLRYLETFARFPVCANTFTEYFSSGEAAFARLLAELEKAQHYIFLEYFLIEDGEMWSRILKILQRKAQSGLLVRVLYDDLGSFLLLPKDYPQQLQTLGIECRTFNPFRPIITSLQNNRDHRKIAVVDGLVAFTGGFNLADEYINVKEKHGHWKDAAILLEGEGAWSLTLFFLQLWELSSRLGEDFSTYCPQRQKFLAVPSDGYVQPYADSPMDQENVGEHVYLQMIQKARHYLYICTPYLIPDENLIDALILAAKSGVDVRIITPHRWDKWLIHMTTRSHYRDLLRGGVQIYEYNKGFIHAKTFVSDDVTATVGTTNLDFRSLYLHFECGVQLYGCSSILAVKQDFLETLDQCQKITFDSCRAALPLVLLQDILRLFSPLL